MTHPNCLIHQVKNCISSLKSLYQNKVAFWGPEGRDFNIWIWKGHSNLHYLGWGMVPDIVPASWAELRPQWTPPGSLILSEALTQHFPASPSVCVCVCARACARALCCVCFVSDHDLLWWQGPHLGYLWTLLPSHTLPIKSSQYSGATFSRALT